ncbi:MAG: hypothetical protein ACK47B_13380 [Armatimonadota bacterium]
MDLRSCDRSGVRLFAINLRLAELSQEMHRTKMRVLYLESQLEDARLAHMMGEKAGDPGEIGTQLAASRGTLETQQELVDQVKDSQWKARVAYTMARVQQNRKDRQEREASERRDAE